MNDVSRRAWVQMAKEFGMLLGFFTFIAVVLGACWALFEYGPLWFIRTIVGIIVFLGVVAFVKATHTDTVKRLEAEDKIHPPEHPARARKLTSNLVDNRDPVDYDELHKNIDSINKHQAEIDKVRKDLGVKPGESLLGYDTTHSASTAWVTKENSR